MLKPDLGELGEEQVLALVRDAVARVLEIDPDEIGRATPLRELGADSLALVEVIELVEEALSPYVAGGFRVDDDDLESIGTLDAAVSYVRGRLGALA